MSKIKISFECTDSWNIQAFRNVVKVLKDTPSDINSKLKVGDIELFLISTDDSTFYIQQCGVTAGLPSDHVFNPGSVPLKLARIDSEKIDIHMDNLQNTVMQIDELSPTADGILVDYKQDMYNLNPMWYQSLCEKINRLVDERI